MTEDRKMKKHLLWDWQQKWSLFLMICTLIFIIIALICLVSANFIDQYRNNLGNGFAILKQHGVINMFHHWLAYDNDAAKNAYVAHPFLQVYVAILFLIIIVPITFFSGLLLGIRGWWKSRI